MRRIALALSVVTLAACSSDPITVSGTDAAADVGADVASKDAGKDAAGNDATTQSDGAAPDSGLPDVVISPDAVSLTCQSPSDCGGGSTPICCATLSAGAGTPPNCPIDSLTSSCKATCTTSMNFSCNSISTVRGCAQSSDCPEPTYGKCCTFTDANNNTATFCTSAGIAAAGGAVCK